MSFSAAHFSISAYRFLSSQRCLFVRTKCANRCRTTKNKRQQEENVSILKYATNDISIHSKRSGVEKAAHICNLHFQWESTMFGLCNANELLFFVIIADYCNFARLCTFFDIHNSCGVFTLFRFISFTF